MELAAGHERSLSLVRSACCVGPVASRFVTRSERDRLLLLAHARGLHSDAVRV